MNSFMNLLKCCAMVLGFLGIVTSSANITANDGSETSDLDLQEKIEVVVHDGDSVNPNGNFDACGGTCPPDC